MEKLGLAHSLGVSLGFAAFHAFVGAIDLATGEIQDAIHLIQQLRTLNIMLNPARLQKMLDSNTVKQHTIREIRDQDYVAELQKVHITILAAYQLGANIACAEGQTTTNNDQARSIITMDIEQAVEFASTLNNAHIPLATTDLPGELTRMNAVTEPFDTLHNEFLFIRGKCQGILDTSPDPS